MVKSFGGQRENGARPPQGPRDTKPLPRNLLRGFWRLGPAPLSSPWPLLGRRDTAGSQKVLLPRGHHHPRTLSEDTFPLVLVSRAPPAPNPSSHPPGPCPRMQMSVCACVWGGQIEEHRFGCGCSPGRWSSEIHLLHFPGHLLQARPWVGLDWGFQLLPDKQTVLWGERLGQRDGGGWVLGVREAFSRRWSRQMLGWAHRALSIQ